MDPTTFTPSNDSLMNETIAGDDGGDDDGGGFQYGGLPPGWTFEGILYIVMLLRMRIVICYIGLGCNIVVLLLQIKLQSFRKTHFMFGLLLTVSDTIYTGAVLAETYYFYLNIKPIPNVYAALVLASNLLSFLAIIGVGVDRYLALCAIPLKYKIVVTTKKYLAAIAGLIVFSTLYSFFFTRYVTLDSVIVPIRGFVVLTLLVTVSSAVYVLIGISIHRSLKSVALGEALQKTRIKQTKRLLFAFSLILLTNAICYLPHSFFSLYLALQPTYLRYNLLQNVIRANWLFNLRTTNSIFNPVIYWFQVLMREISLPCRRFRHGRFSTRGTTMTSTSASVDMNSFESTKMTSLKAKS